MLNCGIAQPVTVLMCAEASLTEFVHIIDQPIGLLRLAEHNVSVAFGQNVKWESHQIALGLHVGHIGQRKQRTVFLVRAFINLTILLQTCEMINESQTSRPLTRKHQWTHTACDFGTIPKRSTLNVRARMAQQANAHRNRHQNSIQWHFCPFLVLLLFCSLLLSTNW